MELVLHPQSVGPSLAGVPAFGVRGVAAVHRSAIEDALDLGHDVVIDLRGVTVTQSFVDELVGALVLARGVGVMSHLTFRGCTEDQKAIIRFVVGDRAAQRQEA